MPKIVQHPEILVQARRGGTVESLHRACAALAGPGRRDRRALGRPGHGHVLALVRQAAAGAGVARRRHRRALRLGRRGAGHHERVPRRPGLPGRPRAAHARRPRPQRAGPALRRRRSRRATTAPATTPASSPPACTTAGTSPTYQQPGHPAQQAALRAFAALTGSDEAALADRRRRLRHRLLRDARSPWPPPPSPCCRSCCPRSAPPCARTPNWSRAPGWHRHRGHARTCRAPPASAAPRGSAASRSPTAAASPSRSSTAPTAPIEPAGLAALEAVLGADAMTDAAARAWPGRRSRTTPATWSASCSRSSPSDAGALGAAPSRASEDRRALRARGGAPERPAPPRSRLSAAGAAPRSALLGPRLAPQERAARSRRPPRWRPRR